MITTADALEVMTVVAAYHARTAPRVDDRDVALATATAWAKLLNRFDFSAAELIAAVEDRATMFTEAPEVADIIRVARSRRTDAMSRAAAPIEDPARSAEHFPGDAKAAPDPAPYPKEWDAHTRADLYWYALRMHALPHTTSGWQALADQRARERRRRGGQEASRPEQPPAQADRSRS